MADALANGREHLASQPRLALEQALLILRADRANRDALRLAAAAHRALGEADQAIRAELAALAAGERDPGLQATARALDRHDYSEASRLAAEHLARVPDDLAALTLSAEASLALGFAERAELALRDVLERAPPFVPARELLLNALMMMDRMREARELVDEMAADRPGDIALMRLRVRIDTALQRHDDAATVGERIVNHADAVAEDWVSYGDSLRFSGRRTEAELAYRRALALDSGFGRAWWSLADLDAAALSEDDASRASTALAKQGEHSAQAGNLHFALGIAHDARGQHAEAFAHFEAGNRLRREAQPYDAGELTAQIGRSLEHLAPERLPARAETTGPTPIFIVGMPRAGSTLLERMLGMHSQVEALGELTIVPHMIQRLAQDGSEDDVERRIAEMDETALAAMGQWYLARAREVAKVGAPWFTDKLHMNWKHLGLILRMLPQARVIDLRRDALDCCWSNYKTLFARGHPAASDLRDIGLFYRDYVRFADGLRERAPGRIHLARYEELVGDPERVVRALSQSLGLPFEPAMLDFHLSRAPVATASSEQVRRPLNRDGIGAWRPYDEWLGPLKAALGLSGAA